MRGARISCRSPIPRRSPSRSTGCRVIGNPNSTGPFNLTSLLALSGGREPFVAVLDYMI
jgi:hypothetical protein